MYKRQSDEYREILKEAALLHDIGKIGIPENILNKEGKLTDEEYDAMKRHVESSVEIIRHLPNMDYVIPAVLGHHERFDGKGYPRRIAGKDIPLAARIPVSYTHLDVYKRQLLERLKDRCRQMGFEQVLSTDIGCVISCHGGPGVMGLAAFADEA